MNKPPHGKPLPFKNAMGYLSRDVKSFTELTVDESKAIYAAGQTIMEGSATPRDYGIKEIEWAGRLGATAV